MKNPNESEGCPILESTFSILLFPVRDADFRNAIGRLNNPNLLAFMTFQALISKVRIILIILHFFKVCLYYCRSQWPRGLRRRSAAARLLRSWVRIPPGAWRFVCCKCCVLSGRGLCEELIPRPEESYRLWCVVVCDLENLKNKEAMTRIGSQRHSKKKCIISVSQDLFSTFRIKLLL